LTEKPRQNGDAGNENYDSIIPAAICVTDSSGIQKKPLPGSANDGSYDRPPDQAGF